MKQTPPDPIRPVHAPYSGDGVPFSIGLKPLNLADWIEPDAALPRYLTEKQRLFEAHPDLVFRQADDTAAAQAEVLALLADHLPARFPDLYAREGEAIRILPTGDIVSLGADGEPALWRAAQLVQEDLVLMRRHEDGWRLAAASLSFPSSWRLSEKFGRTLGDIHAPVPDFGPSSRAIALMTRIFDNLKPELPVVRYNWTFNRTHTLYLPESELANREFTEASAIEAFVRVERQTLRRLPESGDILFTIRIHIDPLAALRAHPDGAALARGFADQLAALTPDQLAYKHMAEAKPAMIATLRRLAEEKETMAG